MKKITLINTVAVMLICLLTSTSNIIYGKCKQPLANAGKAATICPGTPVTIGNNAVNGNVYAWSSSPAGFSSIQSNPAVSPTITTTYTLTETIVATGCNRSNSVVITVFKLPAAAVGQDQSICSGRCIAIGGEVVAGSTYAWAINGDGYNVNNLGVPINKLKTATVTVCGAQGVGAFTTTYTLTETNSNGCTNSNQVRVTVYSQPKANIGSPTTINSGECITIGASAESGDTYTWFSSPAGFNSAVSNPTVCPAETTIYKLVAVSSSGCTFANSVTVNVIPPKKKWKTKNR